jgi:hypothetical protein
VDNIVRAWRFREQPNERDTVGSVTIRVNDLGAVFGGGLDLQDDQGTFIRNPPDPVDTVHGYPVFEAPP